MAIRAAQSGIQKLYHFTPFNTEHLEDTLLNHRVHFSDPKNFNDPWDCNPWFDSSRVDDPAYRTKCVEILRQSPIPGISSAQQRNYEDIFQAYPRALSELIQESMKTTRDTIAARFRIFCLTLLSDSTVMWSHYAEKHRGICLEFDTRQEVIGGAFRVEYKANLPVLDGLTSASAEDFFQILVNKSSDWASEREYRVLARVGGTDDIPPQFVPVTDGDFLPLPSTALTAIIVGCRSSSLNEIDTLVKKYAPWLSVKRAVLAPDKYSLSIEA